MLFGAYFVCVGPITIAIAANAEIAWRKSLQDREGRADISVQKLSRRTDAVPRDVPGKGLRTIDQKASKRCRRPSLFGRARILFAGSNNSVRYNDAFAPTCDALGTIVRRLAIFGPAT